MTNSLKYILIYALAAIVSVPALALSTDKEKDIKVEADSAELDEAKKVTTYRGKVIATQGSLRLTGETMLIHFNDNDEVRLIIMRGSPATYRQLPNDSENYNEAEALTIEYYVLKDYIFLKEKARIRQPDGSKIQGNHIEYDLLNGKTLAKGAVAENKNASQKSDERVKITIKSKQ